MVRGVQWGGDRNGEKCAMVRRVQWGGIVLRMCRVASCYVPLCVASIAFGILLRSRLCGFLSCCAPACVVCCLVVLPFVWFVVLWCSSLRGFLWHLVTFPFVWFVVLLCSRLCCYV